MGKGDADSGNGAASGDGPPPRKVRMTSEGSSCVEVQEDDDSVIVIKEDSDEAPDPPPSEAFSMGMKAFLASLEDCLNEKAMAIQELEVAMFTLLQRQSIFYLKRRQLELQAEAAHLDKLASRSMDYIPQPGDLAPPREARTLLELSAARRLRRRQARENSGVFRHDEGMSSDDELFPSQRIGFQNRRGRILQGCQVLFRDVSEEFSDIPNVLLKLQQWREEYPDSYYESLSSLCLPQLLNPFIRLQLLDWSPVRWDCIPLQCMPWFRALEGFVKGAPSQKQERPDRQILLASLDMSVIPHFTGFVRSLWDPMSKSQTKTLVERCRDVLRLRTASGGDGSYPVEFLDLLDVAVSRLNKAIEDDIFVPLYPKRFVDDKASIHSRFQERQFWSAVKLLGNILLWNSFIHEEILRELALDKVLNRYLVVGLSNTYPRPGVAKKFRKVVECLPESWLKGSMPELCSLTQVVLRSAQQFHDEQLRYEVEEMVPLLVKMNAEKQARAFLERNQLDLPLEPREEGSGGSSGASNDLL